MDSWWCWLELPVAVLELLGRTRSMHLVWWDRNMQGGSKSLEACARKWGHTGAKCSSIHNYKDKARSVCECAWGTEGKESN